MAMNLHTLPEYLNHIYSCLWISFWPILSLIVLKPEMGDISAYWQFLPCFHFSITQVVRAEGVEWIREWCPRFLWPSQKKKYQNSCSPNYFWNTGPSIKQTNKQNKRTTPSSKSCLVFQRHHTVIPNSAQPWIWFLAESQVGTFKVGVSRQLSPGRQCVPSWGGLSPQFTEGVTTLLQLWSKL